MNQVFLSNPSLPFTLNLTLNSITKEELLLPSAESGRLEAWHRSLLCVAVTPSVTHHPWVPGA